jgi:phospholipid-binding lipoprotein MlaA
MIELGNGVGGLRRRTGMLVRSSVLLAVLAVVGACAQVPKDPDALQAYQEANDPMEPLNRRVFKLNTELDKAVLKPVAKAYRRNIPAFARTSIRNFLNNIDSPQTFVNDVLQGESGRAAETAMRFFVNTVAGFFGFFDVAAQYGLVAHKEDFGQTLAVWGVKEGPYVMLPLFGPNNARHVAGRIGDRLMDPRTYISPGGWEYRLATGATSAISIVDSRSRVIEELEDLEKSSLDLYATIRSLYRQNRISEIRNGKPVPVPVPEIVE